MQKTFWPQAKLSASPSAWKVGNWLLFFSMVSSNGIPIPTPNWLMPQLIKLVLTLTRQNYLRSIKIFESWLFFSLLFPKLYAHWAAFASNNAELIACASRKPEPFLHFPYPIWIWKKANSRTWEEKLSLLFQPNKQFCLMIIDYFFCEKRAALSLFSSYFSLQITPALPSDSHLRSRLSM